MKNNKNLESAFADTENLEMTPEVEQELNKIYEEKEGIDMLNLSEDISNTIIESLVERYKNVEDLKVLTNKNGHGTLSIAINKISSIKRDFLYSEKILYRNIKKIAETDEDEYSSVPNIYDFDSFATALIYIDINNYENCLIDWLVDFKNHILHLDILINSGRDNVSKSILKCYLETKVLCSKIWRAIRESQYICKYSQEADEMEHDNSVLDELSFLEKMYAGMYQNICSLGDYLFTYINKYEVLEDNLFE